jgi:3-oxoacyl-[acyl-carrier protein] reductase
MISSKLSGRRALITGGAQGLGAAITRRLSEAGCDVAIHYFSSRSGAEELAATARREGRRSGAFQADLGNPAEAETLVAEAAAFLGGIDILVNNAGDLVERRFLDTIDADFWERVQRVNVHSALWVTRAARPHLARAEGGASIVNLASLAGRKGGHPGSLAYATAKGAILTWTRALAVELAPERIRVNAVAPGLILGTHFHTTHTTEDSARATIAQIPLGRAGTPDDVARAVTYLASEYDGFLTGATLDINGGVYCA